QAGDRGIGGEDVATAVDEEAGALGPVVEVDPQERGVEPDCAQGEDQRLAQLGPAGGQELAPALQGEPEQSQRPDDHDGGGREVPPFAAGGLEVDEVEPEGLVDV